MSDVLVLNAPALLDLDEIRRRVAPLLARHGALKAFVFGSYARGSADAWSDVDLLVVMPAGKPFVERPLELEDVVNALPVAVDLLVYTPEEFDRGMRRGFGIFDILPLEGVPIL